MKKIFFICGLILSTSSFASSQCDSLYPMLPETDDLEVQIPFNNQAMNNGEYDDGICLSYNLKQETPKQLICTFTGLNKGWMLYQENTLTRETATIGGDHTILFSSKKLTQNLSENMDRYHVDEIGLIAIHHDRDYNFPQTHAMVSCRYIPEEEG